MTCEGTSRITSINGAGNVYIRLNAQVLLEPRLPCKLIGTPRITDMDGQLMSSEAVRILCGSGAVFARSRLKLGPGLAVDITEITGQLDHSDEVVICHATALAVADALCRDGHALMYKPIEWNNEIGED